MSNKQEIRSPIVAALYRQLRTTLGQNYADTMELPVHNKLWAKSTTLVRNRTNGFSQLDTRIYRQLLVPLCLQIREEARKGVGSE